MSLFEAADPAQRGYVAGRQQTGKGLPSAITASQYGLCLCWEKALDERSARNTRAEDCFMLLVIAWVNQAGRTAFILRDDPVPEGFSLKKAQNLLQKCAAAWSPASPCTRGNLQRGAVFGVKLVASSDT